MKKSFITSGPGGFAFPWSVACVLSVILGLFALPFGIISRLWSVIVSVPEHPYYYLTFHANCFHVKSCFLRKIKKKKKMFQYLFRLLKKSTKHAILWPFQLQCILRWLHAFSGPHFLDIIIWMHLSRFSQREGGEWEGRGITLEYRQPLSTMYNCYPCYLCYLRVTKMHFWEKSNTFWTYMLGGTVTKISILDCKTNMLKY